MVSAVEVSLSVRALKIPIVFFAQHARRDAVAARSVSVSLAADCGLIHLMAKRYPAERVMRIQEERICTAKNQIFLTNK